MLAIRAFGFARVAKKAVYLGKWKTDRMPASAFALSPGHGYALGRNWIWHAIGYAFRVFNVGAGSAGTLV